jgi:hypothetical protein
VIVIAFVILEADSYYKKQLIMLSTVLLSYIPFPTERTFALLQLKRKTKETDAGERSASDAEGTKRLVKPPQTFQIERPPARKRGRDGQRQDVDSDDEACSASKTRPGDVPNFLKGSGVCVL